MSPFSSMTVRHLGTSVYLEGYINPELAGRAVRHLAHRSILAKHDFANALFGGPVSKLGVKETAEAFSKALEAVMVNTSNATEVRPHHFATEASTLLIAPGRLPDRLPTTLGNGMDLLLQRSQSTPDAALYLQANGCVTVAVFND